MIVDSWKAWRSLRSSWPLTSAHSSSSSCCSRETPSDRPPACTGQPGPALPPPPPPHREQGPGGTMILWVVTVFVSCVFICLLVCCLKHYCCYIGQGSLKKEFAILIGLTWLNKGLIIIIFKKSGRFMIFWFVLTDKLVPRFPLRYK